jgi:hypothetical protein
MKAAPEGAAGLQPQDDCRQSPEELVPKIGNNRPRLEP